MLMVSMFPRAGLRQAEAMLEPRLAAPDRIRNLFPLDSPSRSVACSHAGKEVMCMDYHSRSYGRTLAQEVTSS
jgi:hypothetical protein